VESTRINDVLGVLENLGLNVAEDHLPTRIVLHSTDGRRADLHPVTFDKDGTGWQSGASPDGSDCLYPPDGFGEGVVLGTRLPCLTAALQVEHHRGYEPREVDRHDVGAIAAAFDIDIPTAYRTGYPEGVDSDSGDRAR
jgi:lincosamide nucleotidyltransferase A/C/D/E